MNTKRLGRWVIVLFLLAALPGMTAVLAQGQEPAGKAPLPAVTELSESPTPLAANLSESEPNNNTAGADVMALQDVMAGAIGAAGDVDYFKFQVEDVGGPTFPAGAQEVLINLDAQSIGSPLDTVVTLLSGVTGNVIGSNDDTDTLDSLYYFKLLPGWYYIKVEEFGNNAGGANYVYNLIVSRMILVSAHAAGLGTKTIQGISFQAGDILAHTTAGTGSVSRWVMFLDVSDLGTTKNIDKIATMGNSQDILIGFSVDVTLPGTSIVAKPHDIIRFQPGKYGGLTQGSMSRYLIGANNGLTTAGEKLDAIGDWTAGDYNGGNCGGYPVSTVGAATVNKLGGGTFKAADEDVFCKQDAVGVFKMFYDNSGVAGLAAEDVIAFDYNDHLDAGYYVILGTGVIGGNAVNQKQIFSLWPGNPPTWRNLSWNGPDYGWLWNLDAIDVSGY
jgi:hypothetical protein